jgi:2'-5' RNA ligase
MPKLFVAVCLPEEVTTRLVGLHPAPGDGIRLQRPEQMHVTLHFVGEAEVERLDVALRAGRLERAVLQIRGVGQFPSQGGSMTLWAGVTVGPDLLRLHGQVGAALARAGIVLEKRSYNPHVTIARCAPSVPARVVEAFLSRHAAFSLPGSTVAEIGLYSSVPGAEAPVYRCERAYPCVG